MTHAEIRHAAAAITRDAEALAEHQSKAFTASAVDRTAEEHLRLAEVFTGLYTDTAEIMRRTMELASEAGEELTFHETTTFHALATAADLHLRIAEVAQR